MVMSEGGVRRQQYAPQEDRVRLHQKHGDDEGRVDGNVWKTTTDDDAGGGENEGGTDD